MKLSFRSILTGALLAAAGAGPSSAQAVHQRHLFLDPALLDRIDNATVQVNPASRRETVIFPDKPWERHIISFFLTVREEQGKLRMWYVCRDDYGDGSEANLAYAESTDGITWTKPSLGIHSYQGSRDNNL